MNTGVFPAHHSLSQKYAELWFTIVINIHTFKQDKDIEALEGIRHWPCENAHTHTHIDKHTLF